MFPCMDVFKKPFMIRLCLCLIIQDMMYFTFDVETTILIKAWKVETIAGKFKLISFCPHKLRNIPIIHVYCFNNKGRYSVKDDGIDRSISNNILTLHNVQSSMEIIR